MFYHSTLFTLVHILAFCQVLLINEYGWMDGWTKHPVDNAGLGVFCNFKLCPEIQCMSWCLLKMSPEKFNKTVLDVIGLMYISAPFGCPVHITFRKIIESLSFEVGQSATDVFQWFKLLSAPRGNYEVSIKMVLSIIIIYCSDFFALLQHICIAKSWNFQLFLSWNFFTVPRLDNVIINMMYSVSTHISTIFK